MTDLRGGDLVLVRPGASVPADGRVQEDESQLSEAMITGESRPVPKCPGDELIAGTVNGSGSLRVQVTKTGEQTVELERTWRARRRGSCWCATTHLTV